MTQDVGFGANDAQVRVLDDEARLEKARAAAVHTECQLNAAEAVIDRLTEKRAKYAAHLAEIDQEIVEAKETVEELRGDLITAENAVTTLSEGGE